jgi:hypothetical protein
MGTIRQLIKDLRASPSKMAKASKEALNKEIPSLIADFKARSPVDTGMYKESWAKFSPRFNSPGVFASAGIRNTDPKALLMEYGAEPGSAPWYYPGARKRTGKLAAMHGRIWAGGLNPGHSFTIGGAIDPVLFNNPSRQLQIANSVANKVIRVI